MSTRTFLALLALTASSAFAADQLPSSAVPPVDHLVYLSELPASADLMKDAAANGLTVTRLDRTSDRVVVTYRYANGSTASMGYGLLSSAGNDEGVAPRQEYNRPVTRVRTTTVVTPQPEVVYYEPAYRTRYVYSDPVDNFWLPLTIGLGLGWATGGHGHGGYYHGHGGWHR